jgi:hypothetical protein
VDFSTGNTLSSQGLGSYGSNDFSIANFGYTPPNPLPSYPDSSTPLWLQILYGVKEVSSIIDPYILTDKQKSQLELQKQQLEVQKSQLDLQKQQLATGRTNPATPPWVWVLAAVAGVALLVILLKE